MHFPDLEIWNLSVGPDISLHSSPSLLSGGRPGCGRGRSSGSLLQVLPRQASWSAPLDGISRPRRCCRVGLTEAAALNDRPISGPVLLQPPVLGWSQDISSVYSAQGWTDGWAGRWMDGWMNERNSLIAQSLCSKGLFIPSQQNLKAWVRRVR